MKQIVSNKPVVQHILSFCKGIGLEDIVISPGSRNAPMTISFDECETINSINVPDERVAAFYALGISQTKQKPVAITCTSGSAVANYLPAITEAFYRRIPLIVLSADRPEKWINQGDGQTIMQKGILGNHVGITVEISDEYTDEINKLKLQEAFAHQKEHSLPIHINVHFNEPLYDTIEKEIQAERINEVTIEQNSIDYSSLNSKWNKSTKKMILVGQMNPNKALAQELNTLAQDTSTIVLIENLSNQAQNSNIHCIDRILNSIELEDEKDFAPDLLITLGDAIISKRIKAFLRRNKPKNHWNVNPFTSEMNTYESLTHAIDSNPFPFLLELNKEIYEKHLSNYGGKWKSLNYQIQDKHQEIIHDIPFSDLNAVSTILDFVPNNSVVHLSNSAVIRYAQLIQSDPNITYQGNRGTSGIDGSTSTAIGSAIAEPNRIHVLITGDISFMYDSNAWWSNHIPANLVCFVINNNGGGIFKIIDGPSSTNQLKNHFVAEHSGKVEGIANAFGIRYSLIQSKEELIDILPKTLFQESDNITQIIEINTSSIENEKVLKDYFAAVKLK